MTPLEISLFPMQTVLFPGGYLPLRIFEVRYLDMMSRCQQAQTPFGVVSLTGGGQVRGRQAVLLDGAGLAPEAFQSLGTLAHINAFERPQPGLIQVRCSGGQRFRVLSSERLPHGLWVAKVALLADDPVVTVPADLTHLARALQLLLHKLEQGAAAADLPLQPPYLWTDSTWLSNRWSELLPLAPAERQRFMQLDSPLLRLELVADQLDRLGLSGN
jgi:Lon protease-like protein